MQRPFEMGVPAQYEPSPYSNRFKRRDMASTKDRQMPSEFTPGGYLDMDSIPNPAFAPENVGDMFSGLNGFEDVQAELEQAYTTAVPSSTEQTIVEDIQKGINAVNVLTGKKPQVATPVVTQTQPWMWIGLGLLVGGTIYLMMSSKKGGK
jgi:hypothetical protein